jgi:hypothetical protein
MVNVKIEGIQHRRKAWLGTSLKCTPFWDDLGCGGMDREGEGRKSPEAEDRRATGEALVSRGWMSAGEGACAPRLLKAQARVPVPQNL